MEYKKNDHLTVTIEDLGTEGEGIGRVDGFTLFVKDTVPGDRVEVKIVKCKKNYAYARLEKVLMPSPFRVKPECAYHRQCGGCQLQTLSYEKQLEFKQNKIRNNLIRIGGFSPEYIEERMEPILGMEKPFHYRNKAQYPVGTDREGKTVAGFYAGRTHTIIANTDCSLGIQENREILEVILEHMRRYHIPAYDETTGNGLVRHVLIRKGFTSGEIMVCLVVNKAVCSETMGSMGQRMCSSAKSETCPGTLAQHSDVNKENTALSNNRKRTRSSAGTDGEPDVSRMVEFIPEQNRLLEKLEEIKGLASVSVSVNTERTNVIMGRDIYTLWGSPAISDTIHVRNMQKKGFPFTGKELTFHISPLSFYQVNPIQTEKLYSLALEYAGLTGEETVWDLYCGIGTISLFLADSAKKVYGVEVIPQAVEDARENARRNGIGNAEFFVGKAEEVLPTFYLGKDRSGDGEEKGSSGETSPEADMLHPDVIVVDPPRKGCDEACLETMLKMGPERIVYVSCDSATLARDLKVLCEGGYEIARIRGVDQFGMTVHVETVVQLSQRKPDDVIEVELDLDEFDITASETKATYQEIRQYVMDHTGLLVSNLYIAQVKQKCGFDMRLNYNLPKSENARQPKCPADKEAAIMDALKHFQMI